MSFCPQCGKPASDQARFCKNCGTTLDTPVMPAIRVTKQGTELILGAPAVPAPQASRSGIGKVLGGAFLMVILCGGAVLFFANQDGPTEKGVATTAATRPVVHGIDEEITVGYWSYVCKGEEWTPTIGEGYSAQKANAQFMKVDLIVRNNDTTSSMLPPFFLIDDKGRRYDASSEATIQEHFLQLLDTLNPDVSKRGYVAFDVPSDRQYRLVLSGGRENDETAFVMIPSLLTTQ